MINQLIDQHHQLLNVFDELCLRVSASRLEDGDGLSRCRWQLHRVLTQHLALEDEHIYRRLAREPQSARIAILLAKKAELVALVDIYHAHFAHWTLTEVNADWPGYRASVDALVEQARTRIAWEEQNLFPALRTPVSYATMLKSA